MGDAVRKPGKDVEKGMLVGGQNVGQVCTIENVFKSRKNSDPDVRTVRVVNEAEKLLAKAQFKYGLGDNIPTAEEVDQPCPNGQTWEKELSGGRHQTTPDTSKDGEGLQSRC